MYEEEMRETGLRGTQFTLLQALEQAGPITQGILGEVLGLDSTTLTRSMRSLVDLGLVRSVRGEDRRERIFSLTTAGEKKMKTAAPSWRRAQLRFKKAAGPGWDRVELALVNIAGAL